MADPPSQRPPEQQRPPQQQAPPSQQRDRPAQQGKADPKSRTANRPSFEDVEDTQPQKANAKPGLEVEEVIAVAGSDGEKHLAYEWVDVWIGNNKPMYIIVTSLPDRDLDVTMEQGRWKKNYKAKGRVQTDVTPVAPIGTTGQLVAKDLVTGEELTVNFVWGWIKGPGLFSMLAKLIKRLFTSQS